MTFPSLTFALFFVVVLGLCRSRLSWPAKKTVLLVASYVFYAAWNPPFVALLWLSTGADWWIAHRVHRSDRAATKKAYVALSLAINLGLLAYFKYGGFVVENLAWLDGAWSGGQRHWSVPDIVLPVGISFYTFQTLSYTLDVYRGRLTPGRSLLDYALYVTFFPQLVAGPIVRAGHFLPQAEKPRSASRDQIGWGFALLGLGLFQKVVLADALLGPVVDVVYAGTALPGTTDAWAGTLAFAGQIFFDFSGYSTCAIGVALCLGFHLPDNFRAPYAALGFSDFWRRWHISLSTWLRDYLYIPLGGSRHGAWRTAAALVATMFLGGLWHGASWTFVIWGLLHGVFLVVEHGLKKAFGARPVFATKPARAALTGVTWLLVTLAWVPFVAPDVARAKAVAQALLGLHAGPDRLAGWEVSLVGAVLLGLLAAHRLLRDVPLEAWAAKVPPAARTVMVALLYFLVLVSPGQERAFIYFQF